MDEDKDWYWYGNEPMNFGFRVEWVPNGGTYINLADLFNIAPFDGDWKDSLMECGK